MLQSSYSRLVVLSRGSASRADLACLVHTRSQRTLRAAPACCCLLGSLQAHPQCECLIWQPCWSQRHHC